MYFGHTYIKQQFRLIKVTSVSNFAKDICSTFYVTRKAWYQNYWLVKTYISNRKLIILGSLHGESDAFFSFYKECFNTFSTVILILIILVLKGSTLFL